MIPSIVEYSRPNLFRLLFIAIAMACTLLHGCHRDSPEDRVRDAVLAIQKGIEDKDVKAVIIHLAQKYRDHQGNDREAVKTMLLYYFLQHQKISVLLTDVDITLEGSTAAARFQAVLSGRTGTGAGRVFPEAVTAYRFYVSFSKEIDEWLINTAQWESLDDVR